jgi:hypothetical protein
MGLLKDLTGTYQRGLVTLSIPMLIDAAIMLYLGRQARAARHLLTAPAIADALESPNL